MVASVTTNERQTLLASVARWWHGWRQRRAALAELAQCSSAELDRLGRH